MHYFFKIMPVSLAFRISYKNAATYIENPKWVRT